MKLNQIAITLTLCGAVFSSQGALVISEVLFNEVGSDVTGEWIEIFNNGPTALDLSNYKIGDEETSGGTGAGENLVRFPAGASIAPGEAQVVAVTASRFLAVYGFLPDYEVTASDAGVPDMLAFTDWDPDGGAINMGNSNDQALLLDGANALVDAVNWGNTFNLNPGLTVPVADGTSYERINPFVDTDTAADWKLGSLSSPGIVPEPATLSLLGLGLGIWLYRRRQ